MSPHYQIELHKKGNLDSIQVNCERCETSIDKQNLAGELRKRIKDMIGVSAEINVLDEGQVPRSEGKAARVIDLRNK